MYMLINVCLFFSAIIYCGADHDFLTECKTKMGITDEDIKTALQNGDHEKITNLNLCVFQRMDFIKNGKINVQAIREYLDKQVESQLKCVVEVSQDMSDDCEVIELIEECMKNNFIAHFDGTEYYDDDYDNGDEHYDDYNDDEDYEEEDDYEE